VTLRSSLAGNVERSRLVELAAQSRFVYCALAYARVRHEEGDSADWLTFEDAARDAKASTPLVALRYINQYGRMPER
jgi:heme oxygenase